MNNCNWDQIWQYIVTIVDIKFQKVVSSRWVQIPCLFCSLVIEVMRWSHAYVLNSRINSFYALGGSQSLGRCFFQYHYHKVNSHIIKKMNRWILEAMSLGINKKRQNVHSSIDLSLFKIGFFFFFIKKIIFAFTLEWRISRPPIDIPKLPVSLFFCYHHYEAKLINQTTEIQISDK